MRLFGSFWVKAVFAPVGLVSVVWWSGPFSRQLLPVGAVCTMDDDVCNTCDKALGKNEKTSARGIAIGGKENAVETARGIGMVPQYPGRWPSAVIKRGKLFPLGHDLSFGRLECAANRGESEIKDRCELY